MAYFHGGRLPREYRERSCQGRGWRKAFPLATKQQVREFLSVFVSAFAFDECERLKLSPADQVLNIYRAQYPSRLQPDAMELETLALDFERHYRQRLEMLWNDDLTLGDLFRHTLEQSGVANRGQPSHRADSLPAKP
ncbi:hypothetical protein [Ahniella affigens]|uniref:hypothetical protein n=1 Tax=Ahniella affigens TaxID=2021234 RepID=UPI00197DCD1C|nr:hypothetical protein [Ahniella affigens]